MSNDLAIIGVDVILKRVKITKNNLTGDEARAYPSPDETIKITFYDESESRNLTEEGYSRPGRYVCYSKPEDNIKKSDIVIIRGESYLVEHDPLVKGFPNVLLYHTFTCSKTSIQ